MKNKVVKLIIEIFTFIVMSVILVIVSMVITTDKWLDNDKSFIQTWKDLDKSAKDGVKKQKLHTTKEEN